MLVDVKLALCWGDQGNAGFWVGHCLVVFAGQVVCDVVEALWDG